MSTLSRDWGHHTNGSKIKSRLARAASAALVREQTFGVCLGCSSCETDDAPSPKANQLQRPNICQDDPSTQVQRWEGLASQARFRAKRLAVLTGVGLRQLERQFQQLLHLHPQKWLHSLLILEAETLLRKGKPIKEVAYLLGFAQPYNFTRLFKQRKGITPVQFVAGEANPNRMSRNAASMSQFADSAPLNAPSQLAKVGT